MCCLLDTNVFVRVNVEPVVVAIAALVALVAVQALGLLENVVELLVEMLFEAVAEGAGALIDEEEDVAFWLFASIIADMEKIRGTALVEDAVVVVFASRSRSWPPPAYVSSANSKILCCTECAFVLLLAAEVAAVVAVEGWWCNGSMMMDDVFVFCGVGDNDFNIAAS